MKMRKKFIANDWLVAVKRYNDKCNGNRKGKVGEASYKVFKKILILVHESVVELMRIHTYNQRFKIFT